MNVNQEDCDAFMAVLGAKAAKEGADCAAAFAGKKSKNEDAAQRDLFNLLILNTGNRPLIRTLSKSYDGQGYKAIQYIKGLHAAGGNGEKIKVANKEYKKKLGDG